MKSNLLSKLSLVLVAGLLSFGLHAQEKEGTSEIHVKIMKEGKLVKDTVYQAKDEKTVEMAVKMLDMTLGEESHMKGEHVYTFKTDDGETFEWKSDDGKVHKMHQNVYVISDDEGEDEDVTVILNDKGKKVVNKKEIIVKKTGDSDEEGNKEVIVITKDDDDIEVEEIDQDIEWIDAGDHKVLILDNGGKEKTIKVISKSKEGSNYNFTTEDGKRIIIKQVGGDDDKEIELEVTVEDEKAEAPKEKKRKKEK